MRLSLAAWSFPSLTLAEVWAVARALGVGAVDVGLTGRSALDRAAVLADPVGAAQGLAGLDVANLYWTFADGIAGRNLARLGTADANARDLERVLAFADAAAIPTVFLLPGIVNPGQSRDDARRVATESLRVLLDVPGAATLCVEPHVMSWCEGPDLARRLCDDTGVRLALDYAHFVCLGYRQEEVDPLAPLAAHVHLRQARPGALQAKFAEGTLNVPALLGTLRDAGYAGALALEAVHQDWMGTLFDDVMTETVAMRDAYLAWRTP